MRPGKQRPRRAEFVPRSPLEEAVVAQAVAVLMHERRLTEPAALHRLWRFARNQRRSLAEVALGMRLTTAWKGGPL